MGIPRALRDMVYAAAFETHKPFWVIPRIISTILVLLPALTSLCCVNKQTLAESVPVFVRK
jgi:hypothetical protein